MHAGCPYSAHNSSSCKVPLSALLKLWHEGGLTPSSVQASGLCCTLQAVQGAQAADILAEVTPADGTPAAGESPDGTQETAQGSLSASRQGSILANQQDGVVRSRQGSLQAGRQSSVPASRQSSVAAGRQAAALVAAAEAAAREAQVAARERGTIQRQLRGVAERISLAASRLQVEDAASSLTALEQLYQVPLTKCPLQGAS